MILCFVVLILTINRLYHDIVRIQLLLRIAYWLQ